MTIKVLDGEFTVCKVKDIKDVLLKQQILFLGKTEQEISLVCRSENTPNNALKKEEGFSALFIDGELDFSLTGILSKITAALAQNNIAVFAVSTFNTDYVLVRKENLEKALTALRGIGFNIS